MGVFDDIGQSKRMEYKGEREPQELKRKKARGSKKRKKELKNKGATISIDTYARIASILGFLIPAILLIAAAGAAVYFGFEFFVE